MTVFNVKIPDNTKNNPSQQIPNHNPACMAFIRQTGNCEIFIVSQIVSVLTG